MIKKFSYRHGIILALLVIVLLIFHQPILNLLRPDRPTLSDAQMNDLAYFINDLWFSESPSAEELDHNIARLDLPAEAVYLALRSDGRRLAELWETEGTTAEALAAAITRARNILDSEEYAAVNRLEISLGHSLTTYNLNLERDRSTLFSNIHRGIWGLEIEYRNIRALYAPTYIVASNRSNSRLIELFRRHHEISEEDFNREAKLATFEAEQLLVILGEEPGAVLMQRGNTLVEPESVTYESTKELAHLAGRWLVNNVHEDGRMTYKYWPSSARESEANNMIRQWMATVALIRKGKAEDDPQVLKLAEKNINYNLDQFYHEENGYGLIEFRDQVKLGAIALAALALLEHPEGEKWAAEEKALQKTIDFLWNEDGSLTSFYKPVGDMRFQNFYPGEALLYWAELYKREPDPELLDKFMKSFEYYRAWHLEPYNRNPAFIPWHTQAYYTIYQLTGYEPLKDFIFEMNDWLLPVQQWEDEVLYPDTLGRFYDPDRPFGPPHSSSTGVYLEGLIDAFVLAREAGDQSRMESYRRAINRGLRSVMQLQFVDEVDMFYVSPPMRPYVEGGIRTTVYDNEIRCDNVQHNYMAILKIIKEFEEDDFGHY